MIECKYYQQFMQMCRHQKAMTYNYNCQFDTTCEASVFCKYFTPPEEIPIIDIPTARYIIKRIQGTQVSKDLEDHQKWMRENPNCPLTLSDSIYYRGLRQGKESACQLIETILRDGR